MYERNLELYTLNNKSYYSILATEGIEVATCKVDGKTYREGENFFPKDSCYKCNCGKGFNGKFEEPFCKRINCANQMKFAPEYQRKCAPYYRKNRDRDVLCCPSNWICRKYANVKAFKWYTKCMN